MTEFYKRFEQHFRTKTPDTSEYSLKYASGLLRLDIFDTIQLEGLKFDMALTEISVVLGSYNRRAFLKLAIESIRQELEDLTHEITVVDGGSTDGSLEWLIQQKDILLIVQHNRGVWRGQPIQGRSWGYFMNLAFKIAQGKYVCMLSDDCLVIPGAIRNGHRLFEELLFSGKKVGAAAFYFRDWPTQKKYHVCCTPAEFLYVNHGLYLNQALTEIDYADEVSYKFYGADTDLCMRMRFAGYEIVESPDSYVEHYAHANTRVRSSNNKLMAADNDSLHEVWKEYMLDKQTGLRRPSALIEKEYQDPADTVKKFGMLYLANVNGNLKRMGDWIIVKIKQYAPGLVKWIKTIRSKIRYY